MLAIKPSEVLSSIIINAIETTKENTEELYVHFRKMPERMVSIRICHGSGYSEEMLSKLFEPFLRKKMEWDETPHHVAIIFRIR